VCKEKEDNRIDKWRGLTKIEKYIHGTARKDCSGEKKETRRRGTNLAAKERTRPTSHIRMVSVGMSGSSMFETDARTSG